MICPAGQRISLHIVISIKFCFPNLNPIALLASGHYCVGGVAMPCPAGTYGAQEGLQKLRDCTICPAGRFLTYL